MRLEDQPTDTELLDIWQEAVTAVADLAETLSDEEWATPTALAGWTVGDVVAHVADIEQHLAQSPRPPHEPDWDRLPHAVGDISRFTEVGVDYRRTQPRLQVLAELRNTIALRRGQLDAVPEGGEVLSPFGRPTTIQRLMRIRCLDVWVHEQDIRAAVNRPGHLDTAPAVITAQQIGTALRRVWEGVAGSDGRGLRLVLTGPGVEGELAAGANDVAVTVTLPWPDLVSLAAGRVRVDDAALRSRLVVDGDQALGEALLPALVITP